MQRQFFGKNKEMLLETDFDVDCALVFLPGMSGGAHSSRFSFLSQIAHDTGYACARLALWEDSEALNLMTWHEVEAKLTAALDLLVSRGHERIVLIGKSFGGGLALATQHHAVTQKVLWAPAISFVDEQGNIDEVAQTPLGELNDVRDLTIGDAEVTERNVGVAIGIVHGTEDTVVPLSNSQSITKAVNGELVTIAGADHSFREHETQ